MAEASTSSERKNNSNNHARSMFLQKARAASEACANGDFDLAVQLYSEAIDLDPGNHVLYSNRSAACIRTKHFEQAFEDGRKATELQPGWSKAHYRQGVALQCLGRHGDALAAFAAALAQDEKSPQLLTALTEAAVKSPLNGTLEPILSHLSKMKLEKSPFVVISVIGQELLSYGQVDAAVGSLESALKVGTYSLKLRGSVISALSSAYWKLGNLGKAMEYMEQDLEMAKSLEDKVGECRAHGNLGSAYYSQRMYKEALNHHRLQLVTAMKVRDRRIAASALSSLGHVYVSIGDHPNALASHKQCAAIHKQLEDKLGEAKELGNVGAVYVLLGDYDEAVKCHEEHLGIATELEDKTEEGRAYSNMGSAYHYKRDFDRAIQFHRKVLEIAKKTKDSAMEMRAYAGLGHAFRCKTDSEQAKTFHERQLGMAIKLKDRSTEGRALSNLGIIFQQKAQYVQALKLHKNHLAICKEMEDRAGQGRAYGNMGCAYSALGKYDQAIKFHKQELIISKEVHDRTSESCTHGNLAVAYQAIGSLDKALKHYKHHLELSQELGDQTNESVSLSNLGNFYSSCGDFNKATPFYDDFLTISQQLKDRSGECKACHNLGFAHYSMGNHERAVQYYERNISIARELNDRTSLRRAYCNIGLAYSALGNYDKALECQQQFLSASEETENFQGVFRACGNIADVYMMQGNTSQAINFYERQLQVSRNARERTFESDACGALGNAYRTLGEYEKALTCHQQELGIHKESHDVPGMCKAFGNLGLDYTSLSQYVDAFRCYSEQLKGAKGLDDCVVQAEAFGNLGITKMSMSEYQDALGYFEEQLATLEQVPAMTLDRGRAHGNLGECYNMLGDHEEAVKCLEKYLAAAQKAESAADQDKAYRGLGNTHKTMGNLQQALVCFEKRLVVAHEQTDFHSKCVAYGELGNMHKAVGNFEQANACYEQQLTHARESSDMENESEALCGLGQVLQKMGEFEKALKYHEQELKIAEEIEVPKFQARAYCNLGSANETLGNYDQAVIYQEQYLSIAAQMNDRVAKAQAYSSLGRTHHALGNYPKAISYLKQGLALAEALKRHEDEARLRHRLGLAFWANSQLDASQAQLHRAVELFEKLREEGLHNGNYKISLYELQSACYQALQRVLVALDRHTEALVVAERARTRDFIDFLLERQSVTGTHSGVSGFLDNTLTNPDQITELITSQKSTILYYSIAAGHLFSWLISPNQGILKFHDTLLSDGDHDNEHSTDLNETSTPTSTLLDACIAHVREAMGVEPHLSLNRRTSVSESDIGDETWERESVASLALSTRSYMSADDDDSIMADISGALRSTSTPKTNSLLAHKDLRKLNGVRSSSNKKHGWTLTKPPLRALYELLIAPMEDALPHSSSFEAEGSELVLVLQGDLYLVPFPVLKGSLSKDYLYRRFRLLVVPSLQALRESQKGPSAVKQAGSSSVLVIGNPNVPATFGGQWAPNRSAEHEAKIVADLFNTKPLLGNSASKTEVIHRLPTADCVHFATHVSWKLSALILSSSSSENRLATATTEPGHEGLDFLGDDSQDEPPALSDFLLTAADILDQKLSAKLVVLGAAHNQSSRTRITSDGVIGLTRSFLKAGARSVLVALWPVPDLACKLLLKAFYGGLLRGLKTSHALSQAMHVVQGTSQFSHPSNWAGFILVGGDTVLTDRAALMGSTVGLLLQNSNARETLKVLVHLVDKANQRIANGQRSSMYTAEASIDAKVKGARGWREFLGVIGFRLQKATNGLPDSVFFPTGSSAAEVLATASNNLHALLGLSPTTIQALAKLAGAPLVNAALVTMFNEVLTWFTKNIGNVQVPLNLSLWRTPGCHELLASLGFDLIGVGKDEVMLRSGKINSRRALQCTVQSLRALTDSSETPSDESRMRPLTKARSSSSMVSNLSLMSNSLGSELDLRSRVSSDYQYDDLESISDTASVVTVRSMRSAPGGINLLQSRDRENGRVARDFPVGRSVSVVGPDRRLSHGAGSLRYTSLSRDAGRGDRASRRSILSLSALDSLKVSSVDEPPKLRVSSVDDIHLKVSSVDPPLVPKLEQHADSDIDSYSDIVESRTTDFAVNHSESKSKKLLNSTSASSFRSHGSISSLRSQQSDKSDKSVSRPPQNSRATVLNSTPNGTSHICAIDETVKCGPLVQVATSRSRQPERSRSGDRIRDHSSSNHCSRSGPRHRASLSSDGENLSSDEDYRSVKPQVNHVQKFPGNVLLNSERTSRKGTSGVVSNHVEQLAEQMERARKNSVGSRQRKLSAHRLRADSLSSQESSESCQSTGARQSAAEQAASVLMNNHVGNYHGNSGPGKPSQHLEMKDISGEKSLERRKLRREQLAKMASLQSSSC